MSESYERPVYRTKPLPTGDLRGDYLLAPSLIRATRKELVRYALMGIDDRGHEGLLFWGGRELRDEIVFTTVIRPKVEHAHGRVWVSSRAYGRAARRAREWGILLIAQVHSHPGDDSRHSDGDDEMIGLPTEGMLSIVVPRFGVDFTDVGDASFHQFQDGRWVLCSKESVRHRVATAPSVLDARC